MERWLYIAACVLVPGLWGAVCAWAFGRRDRARTRAAISDRAESAGRPEPPDDD